MTTAETQKAMVAMIKTVQTLRVLPALEALVQTVKVLSATRLCCYRACAEIATHSSYARDVEHDEFFCALHASSDAEPIQSPPSAPHPVSETDHAEVLADLVANVLTALGPQASTGYGLCYGTFISDTWKTQATAALKAYHGVTRKK